MVGLAVLAILGSCQASYADYGLVQTGTATLSQARYLLAATSVGNYALFGGGHGGGDVGGYANVSNAVDIFNGTTGQWTTATLSEARCYFAATSVGHYALFAGGYRQAWVSDRVDIFNASTGQWTTAALSRARDRLAATSVGNFAIFGGGYEGGATSNRVDIFNASTGQWTTAALSQARGCLAATSVGNYALFGGGFPSTDYSNRVDIFNASTGQWTTAALSQARYALVATSVGNCALFGGGYGSASNRVDIFNGGTGQWTTATLSQTRGWLAASSVGNYALFGGGSAGDGVYCNTVDMFNASTGEWTTATLSQARYALAATSVGNYALFGGGYTGSTYSNTVDIFSLMELPTVTITSPTSTYNAYKGSTVNLVAVGSTTNSGGSIAGVNFYEGASLLGSGVYDGARDTWTYAWDSSGADLGNHNITATATDNFGLTATSSPATVVNIVGAPVVAITSPTSTYTANRGITVSLLAAASTTNPFSSISSVQFFDGAALIGSGTLTGGTATSGTWTYAWNTAGKSTGIHNITAKATDSLGAQATSAPATVVNVVVVPPVVAITLPVKIFGPYTLICGKGTVVNFEATATDSLGYVAGVEFYDGATKLGNAALAGPVWTYAWNTAGETFSVHSITAKATDDAGQSAVSAAATVQIRLPGDGDGNGIVDGMDYQVWQNGYQQSPAGFSRGDYDCNGVIDGLDYNIWQNYYGHYAPYTEDTPTAGVDEAGGVASAAVAAGAGPAPPPTGQAPRLAAMRPGPGAEERETRNAQGGTADFARAALAASAGQDEQQQNRGDAVASLTLVFDSAVQVGAGAVEVSGMATGQDRSFTQAYDAATKSLVLTWAQPLAADVYTVRVVADFVVGAGGGAPLDGEVGDPAAPTLPSGDGVPGGDAVLEFTVE